MDISDECRLNDICPIPEEFCSTLEALGIVTLGEFLGATQGLQRFPGESSAWLDVAEKLMEMLDEAHLQAYRQPLPLPPTGLRIKP